MSSHPGVLALSGVLAPCRRSSEGAPHDAAGAAEAERRLGIRLPSDYIAFMETYGAGSIGGDSLSIAPPYSASGGRSVVGLTELFREQAPEYFSRWLPADVSADMLLRWGFTEDCAHLFWLMTGNDSDAWPIVELGDDGPFTVHEGGFADFLRHWCATAAEAMEFMHWREHDHLVEQGLNPSTGLPWGV